MKLLTMLASAVALVATAAHALATETRTLVWEQRPIALTLRAGSETAVRFPVPIQAFVPQRAVENLRVQTLSEMVYLRPQEATKPVRLMFRARDRADLTYLIDVSVTDKAPDVPLVEVADPRVPAAAPVAAAGQGAVDPNPPEVMLTRFMATQFYGPRRLASTLPGARREALPLNQPLPLVRGAQVIAVPKASWSYRGLHGLAVELTNHGDTEWTFDPRDLRGPWVTATAQHALLLSPRAPGVRERGSNQTMVYLLSRLPLHELAAQLPMDGAL